MERTIIGDIETSKVVVTERYLVLWTALMYALGIATGYAALLWL